MSFEYKKRSFPCPMCRKPIVLHSNTNADPGCPEMISAESPGAWYGLLQGDKPGDPATMLILCGTDCLRKLLAVPVDASG